MTMPSVVKVTHYFNKVTLTPITSNPTHESMKILLTELNANAMSVPSDNNPFGHIVLTMIPTDYLQKKQILLTPHAAQVPAQP